MYGLPGQTLQMVSDDLEQLFQLPCVILLRIQPDSGTGHLPAS